MVRTYSMPRNKGIPKVKLTTQIPILDWEWVKENKLNYNTLLESAIAIHRNAYNEGIQEDYFKHLKRRIEVFSDKISKMSMFINDKGLLDEFNEFEGKKL